MPTKKNPAALALAQLSRRKRMQCMTPEQRSAQGRKAVMSRRDRQKPGPWYGLVALPADYVWKGVGHAAKVLDAANANSAEVLFWSQDHAEVVARSQETGLCDRDTLIIEQNWDPRVLPPIKCEYEPDIEALEHLLQVDVEGCKP